MINFKTAPFSHQRAEYDQNKDRKAWGLLWEPGCGKTWPILNEAAYLEQAGEITGLMVLAPNGVHRNWVVDQIPAHLPTELAERAKVMLWQSSKSSTQRHAAEADAVLSHKGFAIACMSYDSIMTAAGKAYWKAFKAQRRCMYVLDESPRIKTPGSKRSKRISGSSVAAPYRRIATGTIVDDKPFDVYNQIRFLDPEAWHEIGCSDFAAFKNTFGIWKKQSMMYTGADGAMHEREFPMLVEYRNLELLREMVSRYGSRLRKEDVLDLPPKLYSTRYFEMTPAQWRVYKELQSEFYTFLESGDMVSADLVITRLLRLQQVTSGYLPRDKDEELVPIVTPNPRIQLLLDCLEDLDHQVIVWAKYQQDITTILAALADAKISAVRYDGRCSETQMGDAVDAFKRGDAQVFVANPAKGSEGITLTCAKTMIYFNNGYRLSQRTQSEDRFHRIGQTDPVHIIDLAAVDTVDTAIIDALRKKYELASFVQGDVVKAWI